MTGAPIDTAYVDIQPKLDTFERNTRRGLDEAFGGIDPEVQHLVDSIERMFNDLADQLHSDFRDISITAENSMERVAMAVEDTGLQIRDSIETGTASAERSFDELRRHATSDLDRIETQTKETGSRIGSSLKGMVGGALILGGVAAAGAGLEQLTSFGLKSAASLEQVQIAFDQLTGSVKAGTKQFQDLQQFAAATPFEFTDLTTAAERFDAFSRTVGISQQQLIPFLTTIGNLVSETGGGAEALNSITLALGQTASQGKLTLGNLEQINNALPGFSAVAALAKVRGESTAKVMDEISSGSISASTGIAQLLQGMQQFPGAAGAMEKQSQTLLGVFSTFKDTVGQALSGAFQPIIPQLKDALTGITPIIGQALGQIAPAIGTVLTALLPIAGALIQALAPILQNVLPALAGAITELAPALGPLGAALNQILNALAPILPLAAELISTLATALAPVIAALTPAISGLVDGLTALIEPLLPIINQLGPVLASIILPIANRLGDAFSQIGQALGPILAAALQALMPLFNALGPLVTQLLDAFTPMLPVLGQLAPVLVQLIVALTPLIELFAELLTVDIAIIAPLLKLVATLVALLDTKALIPLLGLIAEGLGKLTGYLEPVVKWLSEFASWINGLNWGQIGHAIVDAFSTAWAKVSDFFSALPGRIMAFLDALPGMIRAALSQATDAILFGIGYLIGSVTKELLSLPSQIGSIMQSLWDGVVSIWHWGVQQVKNFFTIFIPAIVGEAKRLWDEIKAKFVSGIDAAVEYVSGLPGRIKTWLQRLPGTVKGATSDAGSWLKDAGKSVLEGLVNGIENGLKWAIDKIKGAMNKIVDGAKSALGIKSPSTVFAEIGGYSVQGYQQGVDDNVAGVRSAMSNVMNPTNYTNTSYSGAGGIQFGAGAIQVNVNGPMSNAQAQQAGQTVGQSLINELTDWAFVNYRQPRRV